MTSRTLPPGFPRSASKRFKRRAGLTLACCAAWPLWAQAQQGGAAAPAPAPAVQAPAAPGAAPAAAGQELEPVVVTGSGGVERRVFDTPYAIDVVDAEELRSAGPMVNLSEAMSRVPGLTMNLRNNYAQDLQISSRGYGARSAFGVRGIRLYTDGIPASMPDGSGQVSHFDLAGADRVEVLRGPFSALYGNSSGGVISLISAWPRENAAEFGLDVGSDGLRQVRLGAEAVLGQGFDIRATGSHLETDGPRNHSAARKSQGNVRLGWRGELDTVVVHVNVLDQPAQDPLGLTREQFNDDPGQTAPQAIAFDTRKNTEQSQVGAQWRHRFANDGGLYESVLTAYAGRREVTQWQSIPVAVQGPPTHPGGVIDFDRDYRGVDARLVWRWTVGERTAQLVAGVAVDEQDEHRRGYENFSGSGDDAVTGVTGTLRRNERNEARSTDAYAQGELDLTENVTATLGVRGGKVRYRSKDRYVDNGDDSGRREFEFTNPVAALQWRATPALNLYLSAGRGFEAPTLNELAYSGTGTAGFNEDLKPQRSTQVEVGAKWRERALGLAVDAAYFRARTDDEIGVASNLGGRSTFQNVGRTKRQGVELAARWQATKTLRSAVALTWLDATYRDSFVASCAGANCPPPPVDVSRGNRIAGTAKKSAFAEVAWRAIESTELAVELRSQGNVPVNDLNTDFAPGATTFAVRANHSLTLGPGRLELLARVDNLADKDYAGSVIVNEGNGRFFEPAAGRTVLVSARYRLLF